MGRRKERRLAAISSAGRRVKLDLFAEPSGDVGASSPQEEAGGGGIPKPHAKLPSSPSSSGQQPENRPENPLLLLEQYSDDELDEGSSGGHNHVVADDSSVDFDDKEKVAGRSETGDGENNHDKELAGKCLIDNAGCASEDPSQKLEKGIITETGFDDLQKQTNKMEETTFPAAPDELPLRDVSSCWKMVLHEESNQYYYWNTATGETSWEVPDVLAQANVMTSAENNVEDTERKTVAVLATCKSSTHLDMEEGEMTTNKLSVDSMVNYQTSEDADGSNEAIKVESIEDEEGNRDTSQSNGAASPGKYSVESNNGTGSTDLSPQLIKHCESLLERLNSVKGLNCHGEGQDLKMKCTVEIETRLADIKALAFHGSYFLPFWLHSEVQIKRLEAAVEDIIQRNNSASLNEFEATLESCEGICDDTEMGPSEKNARLTVVESRAENPATKSNYEANKDDANSTEHVSSAWYSGNYPVNVVGGKNEITGTDKGSELAPEPALDSCEDVDMDVDMEVDDTSSVKSPNGGGASCAQILVSTELPNVHHTLGDQALTAPGELFSVAPPVEQWIPPPPPDNEPIPPPPPDDEPFAPPPPPDEPPQSSYPQTSHLGSVQPFSYPEQYTLPYPGSNIEYYGQTNLEVSGSALYTHPEGGQVADAHIPHYYEAAANIYAVAPVVVNPVEPTAYYGLQNGIPNPVSLFSCVAESSGLPSEPTPEIMDSGTAGSMDYHQEAGPNLILETNLCSVESGDASAKAPSVVPETDFFAGAPAISKDTNSVSVSSTYDTTTSVHAASTVTSKSQSKVPRGKKRTVAVVSTLRSNKKVSCLVDKWKAAKEELHEEEEEPKDAYEILERKRQREIEEWRAQQIASGEAKDNANFQPLGGDWRERVKRKRAQKMKESRQNSPDVTVDGNLQPDLVELNKGLPSGWQVYWDASSKQVYYGNVRTAETTWTRPTD